MKKIFFFLIASLIFLSCDFINNKVNNTSDISREEVLEKFEKNFPQFFEENIVDLTNYKKSKIQGFQEGAFVIKSTDGPQVLYFLISNDGNYFIFNPEIIDASGPSMNEKKLNEIDLDSTPYRGNKDSKIVIVEYSDFQCPACKYAAEEILPVLKREEYINKIAIYYKHMPLSFHDWAKKAASFSSCININYGNESFWKVHDIIFKNQSIITSDKFIDNLRIIIEKNSEDDFAICYDEYQKDKYLSRVEKSIKEAKKLGLNSTPSFVINGYIVKGADLVKIIDAIEYFSR